MWLEVFLCLGDWARTPKGYEAHVRQAVETLGLEAPARRAELWGEHKGVHRGHPVALGSSPHTSAQAPTPHQIPGAAPATMAPVA